MSDSKLLGIMKNKSMPFFAVNPLSIDLRTHVSNVFIIALIYLLKSIPSILYIKVDVRKMLFFKKWNLMQPKETLNKEQEF